MHDRHRSVGRSSCEWAEPDKSKSGKQAIPDALADGFLGSASDEPQDKGAQNNAVVTEDVEGVGLDVAQKPFHGRDGGHRRDSRAEEDQGPIDVFFAVAQFADGFHGAGGEKGRNAQEEGEFGGFWTRDAEGESHFRQRKPTRSSRSLFHCL